MQKIIQAVLYPQLASPEKKKKNIALTKKKQTKKGTFNL